MSTTRLGPDGYGVRRSGSFVGKTSSLPTTAVPFTRLGEGGYGVRRYSSFAGKAPSVGSPVSDDVLHTIPYIGTMGAMSCR